MPPAFVFGGQVQKACVFVDGENLRHSLVELLYPTFRKEDYLPKRADWEGFFDRIVETAGAGSRLRTYWYAVQHIDFWPWKIPVNDEPKLQKLLNKHKPFRDQLSRLQGAELSQKLKSLHRNSKESATR